ncbi:MAG: extracellular solute-binding protein [Candidatus Rokubacteria bacterium]|nr:extracellular solute-binding protein [Candidatus Rokubacteria bacterium]
MSNACRRVMFVVLAMVLTLALGLAPRPAAAQTEIVLMTWGGAFHDAFQAVKADIEKAADVKLTFVTQTGAAGGLSRLEAQKANPQVDLWTSIVSTADAGLKSGVVEPLPVAQIPNLKSVPDYLVTPAGTAIWSSLRGIFYRADKVPFEIKTWEDLWDARLKGLVSTSFILDKGNFLIMASLISGGSERDIDKGFERVKALKPNLALFYKTDSESIKFLQAGEAGVAGWGILPNVYKLLGPGSQYRFVVPAKPQFMAPIPISLVKGRPNRAAALRVIDAILAPAVQEKLVENLGSVPANRTAKAPAKIRDFVPPLDNVYKVDWGYVNTHFAEWESRWNREIQTR